MKKAVITILGTISKPRDGQDKAQYYFSKDLNNIFSLKKDRYTNMLPLLIDNLLEQYGEIISIYTNESKQKQIEVLEYENLQYNIENNGIFISEKLYDDKNQEILEAKYPYFLEKFNEIIEKYDKVIIDVSHGFRHLPILATVNLIIQNIKNPQKIEYILFAKEIEKFSKYEIIDLKEYLSLANLSFMLSSFNQNYTVSSNIKFKKPLYKEIANELSEFSNHFLSNSLKVLIEGDLINDLINKLNELKKDSEINNFSFYIDEIISHLKDIKNLNGKEEWEKFYEISKIMSNRGYQLNAITLLFESLGFYCLERLSAIECLSKRKNEYDQYIKEKRKPRNIYSTYTMTNQIKTLVKIQDRFKIGDERLFINNSKIKKEIINYLEDVPYIKKFENLIMDLEALRNNLAHGNTSNSIENVEKYYKKYLKNFENLIVEKDIFQTAKDFSKKNGVEKLQNKFNFR